LKFGAGNEARTRDLDLGKVALYQLSYARLGVLLIFVSNWLLVDQFDLERATRLELVTSTLARSRSTN
jgi:hypothetical protein